MGVRKLLVVEEKAKLEADAAVGAADGMLR
jgi:hypothetical protein